MATAAAYDAAMALRSRAPVKVDDRLGRESRSAPRFALGLLVALAGCSGHPADVQLSGLDGERCTPQQVAAGQVHVIVFLSHECPIANAYAPTLGSLAAGWAGQPVRLYVVYVEPDLSLDAVRAHRREYALPGTVLLDPAQRLAAALGITRTPEAVVLNHDGLVYRGRIDDQWAALGTRSPAATVHDLRDAVAVALRGGKIAPPFPPAVGCLLPEPAR